MQPTNGLIYLLKLQGFNHYKIGSTTEQITRVVAKLQEGSPFKILTIYQAKVKDMATCKDWLHRYFLGRRVRGEWFDLYIRDVQRAIQYMQKFEANYCIEKVLEDSPPDSIDRVIIENEKKAENPIETDDYWFEWLPSKDEIIAGLEATRGNLAYYVKSTLGIDQDHQNYQAKSAIVNMLQEKERHDLIEKLGSDRADYGL